MEDDRATMCDYPMSLLILFAVLDFIKPGGAEVRSALRTYIRGPPSKEAIGDAINEVLMWNREQTQALTMGIEKRSPSEYLEAFIAMIKPLTQVSKVLNTVVANMEADARYSDQRWNLPKNIKN